MKEKIYYPKYPVVSLGEKEMAVQGQLKGSSYLQLRPA